MSIENLSPEHQYVAQEARTRIMALIAGGVVKRVVRIDTDFREPGHEEGQIS